MELMFTYLNEANRDTTMATKSKLVVCRNCGAITNCVVEIETLAWCVTVKVPAIYFHHWYCFNNFGR